jgi:hypothetical protein
MFSRIVKEIKSDIESIGEEIFIVCASFEDRTLAASQKLASNYKIDISFVFKFSEENKTNQREVNFQKLSNLLSAKSNKVIPIICDHHDPVDGVQSIRNVASQIGIEFHDKIVALDISTFTRQYLFLLLKFLEQERIKAIRIFYSEPKQRAINNKPLSFGYIDTVSVPTFGGHFSINKENLLIIFLGLEGARAFSLWEKFSPHKTLLLIGRKMDDPIEHSRVKTFNQKLLDKVNSNCVKYISAKNPFETEILLNKLIEKYISKFNISVSSLGSKPQSVGCYLSLKNYPDVQLLYVIPKGHDEKYYSKDVARIWEFC